MSCVEAPFQNFLKYIFKIPSFYFRSDIPTEILASDIEEFSSVMGMHAIVREGGHYFGNCVYFNPPNVAPIGHDNKAGSSIRHL